MFLPLCFLLDLPSYWVCILGSGTASPIKSVDLRNDNIKECQEKCLKTKGCVAIDYVWLELEAVNVGWCRLFGRTNNQSDPIVAGRKFCELAKEVNPIGIDVVQTIY